MRLSVSELQIMEIFWKANKALSSADIVDFSPADKIWRDNSIYVLIQALEKKSAIIEIGAVKGEKGKYLRLFEPAFSREGYYSSMIKDSFDSASFPMVLSAFLKETDLSLDTIKELEDILARKKAELKKK